MESKLIFRNRFVEAYRDNENLLIRYALPHVLRIPVGDRQAVDDEVIRMLRIDDAEGNKCLVQREVGEIIGVSRQMINRRWQVYKKEGLVALLAGEWEKSKITPELLDRVAEIVVENPFLYAKEIRDQLQQEGICSEISQASLLRAIKQLDGRKLIMLMRQKASKEVPQAFMEAGYMIERLFSIVEDLLTKVPEPMIDAVGQRSLEFLRSYFTRADAHRSGPTEKDSYRARKKLKRDKRRKIAFLRDFLTGRKNEGECPDCHSREIKFVFKRERGYRNEKGRYISDYSRVYRCNNRQCSTKYFTRPPKGVELYARVHRNVKKMTFRWILHLRGSLSRVRDELGEHGIYVALTTVLRWLKKAGEECVNVFALSSQEDWHQPLCIDEKWIKIRDKWCYVFAAVGEYAADLLYAEVFFHQNKQAIKTFLYQLKALGFRPVSITTDLLHSYETAVAEVFPDAIYQQCVLHAGRDARRVVRLALTDEKDREWRQKLTQRISNLFKSTKIKQVKKRYFKIMKLQEKAPDCVASVFKMLHRFYPKLCQSVSKKVPRTTNAVERAIGELEERYQLTKGFTSFYSAQFFIKAYQIYYRLRKITFGRFRGKNRLELKGNPVGKLNFADYLTPTFS